VTAQTFESKLARRLGQPKASAFVASMRSLPLPYTVNVAVCDQDVEMASDGETVTARLNYMLNPTADVTERDLAGLLETSTYRSWTRQAVLHLIDAFGRMIVYATRQLAQLPNETEIAAIVNDLPEGDVKTFLSGQTASAIRMKISRLHKHLSSIRETHVRYYC